MSNLTSVTFYIWRQLLSNDGNLFLHLIEFYLSNFYILIMDEKVLFLCEKLKKN